MPLQDTLDFIEEVGLPPTDEEEERNHEQDGSYLAWESHSNVIGHLSQWIDTPRDYQRFHYNEDGIKIQTAVVEAELHQDHPVQVEHILQRALIDGGTRERIGKFLHDVQVEYDWDQFGHLDWNQKYDNFESYNYYDGLYREIDLTRGDFVLLISLQCELLSLLQPLE